MNTDKRFKTAVNRVLAKRELSQVTKDGYFQKLNKMRKAVDENIGNLDFLKQKDKVVAYVESFGSSASKKAQYITIHSVIKNNRRIPKELKMFYKAQMEQYRDTNNDERLDNVIVEKEKDNWLDVKALVNIPNQVQVVVEEEFEELWLTKTAFTKLNKRRKQKYMGMMLDYVILYLHTQREPLRLDFATMSVKYGKGSSDGENMLSIEGDEMTLYLNKFKNVKKIGKQVQELKGGVKNVLFRWFKLLELVLGKQPEFVFYNLKSDLELVPFNNNLFGKRLTGTFDKYAGKRISVTLLRRIYETALIQSDEYKGMTNRQKKEVHERLLHGPAVAQEYNRVVL